jgi:hypothetical protein
MVCPDNFIEQMVSAEKFIEEETSIGICVPIKVKIECPIRRKKPIHHSQALI